MMKIKKYFTWALSGALGMASAAFMASCSSDDAVGNDSNTNGGGMTDATGVYVLPATVGDSKYLLTATSLDEGQISAKNNGVEAVSGVYWVYKNNELFSLVYNQGNDGTGESYTLDSDYKINKHLTYTMSRFTTYGTWGNDLITVSTGNSTKEKDEDGNVAQAFLFNRINTTDGNKKEEGIVSEDLLGNGEKVTMAGIIELNGKLYTSIVPMGMSKYGIKKRPEMVTDQELIAKQDGGSASSSYKKGEIPSTQYPDNAFIAIYEGENFTKPSKIISTDKIGFASGRMRSQYYQTIWPADNGDIYVFSPGYGRTNVSSADLKRVTGKLKSGVVRIKAGTDAFDDSYYFNFEDNGVNPVYRCWHITEDYFLLQLYKKGIQDVIDNGKNADVSEVVVFKAEDKQVIPVTGLPSDASFVGEPYNENGFAYFAVTVTSGAHPAFYKINPKTGAAVKGLEVEAESISTAGKLSPKTVN